METFVCPSCNIEKSISRASKRVRLGLRKSPDRCLDCEAAAQKKARSLRGEIIKANQRANYPRYKAKQKDSMLKKKYGIGIAEWNEMFAAQGQSCAICQETTPGGRGWQTDHNHATGQVRAILCHCCNSLLGHAKESPEILLGAFRYLYSYGGGPDTYFRGHFSEKVAAAIGEKA